MEIETKNNEKTKEEWGFHGTTEDSIQKISQGGFLHPATLKQIQNQNKKKKKGGKDKPVELLDDGYFGHGIYFTKFSDYA